jgi:predicted nuclease of predicted toxin-antitoxin system
VFVVWLSVGNAGTEIIARLLCARVDALREFLASPEAGLFVLEIFPEKI